MSSRRAARPLCCGDGVPTRPAHLTRSKVSIYIYIYIYICIYIYIW